MRIGNFDVLPLSDGTFKLDGGAMFGVIPKVMWEKRAPADAENRITMGIRPLVVRTGHEVVLIDAGVGDKFGQKEQNIYALDRATALEASLAAAGLSAGDIDVVIATHLHFDHVGGLTTRHGSVLRPVFGRARHLIRRGEFDDATHPHERNRASYLPDNWVPLLEAGLVEFHDEDAALVPGIRVRRTGGHTQHHEIVEIESGGVKAVFAADLLPTTSHLPLPWIMGYDLYPMDTLAYKKRFLEEAVAGEYVIFFEHDPAIAAGILRRDGDRIVVERMLTT